MPGMVGAKQRRAAQCATALIATAGAVVLLLTIHVYRMLPEHETLPDHWGGAPPWLRHKSAIDPAPPPLLVVPDVRARIQRKSTAAVHGALPVAIGGAAPQPLVESTAPTAAPTSTRPSPPPPTPPLTPATASTTTQPPWWCPHYRAPPHAVATRDRPHALVACVYTRIYESDLSAISRLDLLHWLTYYRRAGVEHVYLYDCWRDEGDRLQAWLQPAVDAGFVTYVDWREHSVKMLTTRDANHIELVEIPARQHCLENFGHLFKWVLHLDVDEFPFMPADTAPRFLSRFFNSSFVQQRPRVSEFTLANYLMLGWRNYSRGALVFQQVQRRTRDPGNQLVKPIVLGRAVSRATVHHNSLSFGSSLQVPPDLMRMHHFWGGRLQDWKPNMSARLLDITEADASMLVFVEPLLACAWPVVHPPPPKSRN